jgi:hypothetical protein
VTDVRGARITRMMADPDCGGDLLLLGCALAAFIDFGMQKTPKLNSEDVARQAWSTSAMYRWRFKDTVSKDARTYKPPRGGQACMAPMQRRDGTCGKRSSWSGYLTDWETGEKTWLVACSRHGDWHRDTSRANWEAKPEKPPLPAANHGGVLARHFPEFAWPALWKWADPLWVEHPETKRWPKPTLTLHLGDGAEDDGARPMLAVVQP